MVSRADDLRLRELLNERLGAEATDKLLERLPLTPVEHFATKDDITALRGEMLDEFGKVRSEFGKLRGEFGELRGEVRGELGSLRGELGDFKAEVSEKLRMQTWATVTAVFTGIAASTSITAAIAG